MAAQSRRVGGLETLRQQIVPLALTLALCVAGTVALGGLSSARDYAAPAPPTPGPAPQAARHDPPAQQSRPAPASQPLSLVFPLRADEASLERYALAVSTPGSPRYGQFESIAELARRFGASPHTRRSVLAALRAAGAQRVKIDATGLFADAQLSARRAERMFAAPLARLRSGRYSFIAPTRTVVIPPTLRGLVGGVIGLDTRPLLAPVAPPRAGAAFDVRAPAAPQPSSGYPAATGTPSGCAAAQQQVTGFTPAQYLTAYDYPPLYAAGITGQGERVALIEIDGFRKSDVAAFAACFGLHVPPIETFGVGVNKPLAPGGESTLDIEALDAAAPGLKAIDVYESDSDAAQTLMALTAPLQNGGFKPQVISASLGLCEQYTAAAIGTSGLSASEAALAEAAASGISVLAASGDTGSADCLTPMGVPIDHLAVNYPASSPWVTAVGGTNLTLTPANAIASQVVWNDAQAEPGAASGGGFSVLFKRPDWQVGTVAATARALPDISMLADIAPGYDVYCTTTPDCINDTNTRPWVNVGGTSASTPLLAGAFALVDEDLRLHERQDLGFVNPLLYKLGRDGADAAAFSDVTAIGNDVGPFIPGNGLPLGCCTAAPGYDAASGWGSVNVASFAALALAAQPAIVDVALSLPAHQAPIAGRRLLATVSCTGPCLMGAFAVVTIPGSGQFTAYSRVYNLHGRASRTVAIPFSAGELTRLRLARTRHQRLVAQVHGAIVDPAGNIERESTARIKAWLNAAIRVII
ncbi:MAG: S53 family peptidase [Solirubrobacteraceae bacterium]